MVRNFFGSKFSFTYAAISWVMRKQIDSRRTRNEVSVNFVSALNSPENRVLKRSVEDHESVDVPCIFEFFASKSLSVEPVRIGKYAQF